MEIILYGTPSAKFIKAHKLITGYMSQQSINYSITVVEDVNEFIRKGIQSIPALQVNDGFILSLDFKNSEVSQEIKQLLNGELSLYTPNDT